MGRCNPQDARGCWMTQATDRVHYVEHLFDQRGREGMLEMTMPETRDALVGPAAQKLTVGLLAARTAGVLRRIQDGEVLDDVDGQILGAAADMLEDAATTVEAVIAGGHVGRVPGIWGFGAISFTVDVTAGRVPAELDLPGFLRDMARSLTRIALEPSADLAQYLLPAFSELAEVATQQAGSVGEGGGAFF